jgi:hypothetical protein
MHKLQEHAGKNAKKYRTTTTMDNSVKDFVRNYRRDGIVPTTHPHMTDEKAAHVMAQHIIAIQAELRETTEYLAIRRFDTKAAVTVDLPTAIGLATGEVERAKKIEIMKARRNCAALVLDALMVAKERTEHHFRDLVDREVLEAVPKKAMFVSSVCLIGCGGSMKWTWLIYVVAS